MIDLKNPKIEDLAAAVDELEVRIAQLETYAAEIIAERTARIEELEHAIADHQAGAARRQQELDRINADTQRLRWAIKTGRRP